MAIDLAALAAELQKQEYQGLIADGDHQSIADILNGYTVDGDAYVALSDLKNILTTALCVPRLQRDAADTGSPTRDLSATLLWSLEHDAVDGGYRMGNPAIAQGLPALQQTGVLSEQAVTAIGAAARPVYTTPAQAAGAVGPGETVTDAEITWAWGRE